MLRAVAKDVIWVYKSLVLVPGTITLHNTYKTSGFTMIPYSRSPTILDDIIYITSSILQNFLGDGSYIGGMGAIWVGWEQKGPKLSKILIW